jgi:MFS family permease
VSTPWFDEALYGTWFGVLVGGVGGTLGGLLGAVAGTLAPQGKGRAWVLGSMWAFVGLGVALGAFGLVALFCGQPVVIWSLPLGTGGGMAVLFGILTPVVRRRYVEAEERRLQAEALRHG